MSISKSKWTTFLCWSPGIWSFLDYFISIRILGTIQLSLLQPRWVFLAADKIISPVCNHGSSREKEGQRRGVCVCVGRYVHACEGGGVVFWCRATTYQPWSFPFSSTWAHPGPQTFINMTVLMWDEVGSYLASLSLRQISYEMMSEVIFQTGLHE